MEIVSAVKDKAIDPVIDIVTGTPDALKDTFTTKEGAFAVGTIVAGSVVGGLTAAVLTFVPFSRLPFGSEIAQAVGLGVGVSMTTYGMKTSNMVWTLGGAITTLAATRNILGILGIGGNLTRYMAAEGDNVGYFGHMNLDGYRALDSVEVDRASLQPTQNYGAETIEQEMTAGTPQVEIAQEMVGNNLDSVRQEAAMGHGVTQWFGAENLNSATSFNKRMDMKKFAASTDVGGNRTRTGDDSMANVVGGTSMADSAPAMTAYDVSMEAGILPQTKELGGGVQDVFDTYILPSYEMPSAGASGHGVTQWYAESNQTGFIGNFVAGAEGHGSVLGQ
tara:strand:- start:1056 stop:2057 length:1002 start_codon:yes stop_codon:yes gene_type:complete